MSAVAERTVTTLDADTSDSSLLGQGILALQAGRFVDAVACFSEVVEASPEDTVAYRHLAVALQKIGREEDALHVWRVAKSVGMASPSGG
jgi:Flp pilus assembly protein TadD